jgi:nucleoside-diphosphate-sugar epimerase
VRVLVTGATGFVGRAVVRALLARPGVSVVAGVRRGADRLPDGVSAYQVEGLSPGCDWSGALRGCDVVVHLAARVHMMRDSSANPLEEYRFVNTHGTLSLARQALEAGVRRFVFVSSIKVNGERTEPGRPFSADDVPRPIDPYAISKWEAERGIQDLAREGGMEAVIIRPPLVYGPGVGANFRSMLRWVARGIPLPLRGVDNRRSLVALDNLVDLISVCTDHPAAANQLFLVSDGEDVSTADLLRRIARELRTRARLVKVPPSWLVFGASLLGKRAIARRLCDSLQVDSQATRARLGWSPPLSLDEGLRIAVRDFAERELGLAQERFEVRDRLL